MKWNEFRKSQCGAEATAATAPAAAPAPLPSPTRSAAPVAIGNAVFPSAIDPKYSNESAGKARRETCLEQYNANKANNANGGLKWIQRGGGYYSECNRRRSTKFLHGRTPFRKCGLALAGERDVRQLLGGVALAAKAAQMSDELYSSFAF
jgi:hypothetical protein